jgi:hypothetical protein
MGAGQAGGRKTQARVRAPLDIREWVTCAAGMNERRVGCFLGGWHATSFGRGWKRSRSPVFLGEAGHRRAPNASLIWLRHFGCWFPLFSLCSAGGFRIARARASRNVSLRVVCALKAFWGNMFTVLCVLGLFCVASGGNGHLRCFKDA